MALLRVLLALRVFVLVRPDAVHPEPWNVREAGLAITPLIRNLPPSVIGCCGSFPGQLLGGKVRFVQPPRDSRRAAVVSGEGFFVSLVVGGGLAEAKDQSEIAVLAVVQPAIPPMFDHTLPQVPLIFVPCVDTSPHLQSEATPRQVEALGPRPPLLQCPELRPLARVTVEAEWTIATVALHLVDTDAARCLQAIVDVLLAHIPTVPLRTDAAGLAILIHHALAVVLARVRLARVVCLPITLLTIDLHNDQR
mmetsp:Transcript_95894/g.275314  ORF Transcript_95894/g.275314 Transcript_95894/m.275314 type:complete len:251 (+) Transcript_95894:245-997(+)